MQSLVDNSRNMKQEKDANLKRKIDRDESTAPPPQKMQRQDIVNLLKQDNESPASNLVIKSQAPAASNDKLETTPRVDTKNVSVENSTDKPKQTVNSDSKIIKSKTISNKKSRLVQSNTRPNDNKEKDSEKECTQCGKSSEHISTIIKQVSDLEKKLTIDMSRKEEKFKMEKEAWKVREKELKEALAQKDDGPSKEFSEIKIVLEKNKEELDLAILEKDEQANKIVTMQALNDDLDDKYDKVKKELENLKKLKNVDKDLKEKAKQNEDTIAVQAKSISTLELEMSQKGEQINSLKSDLETKEKQILNKEFVLLELKEKEDMLKLADEKEKEKEDMLKLAVEKEKELKEKIEQIEKELQEKNGETERMLNEKNEDTEKEIQSKDQIISDFELKAIESENTMNNLQNEIIKKEDSMAKILEEREQWENKYIKSQEFTNNLKQENEEQKAQNQYLVKWKETETDKLRSSLKLRLSTMIEKNVAKDKLYQQKIQSLENLLNEKDAK